MNQPSHKTATINTLTQGDFTLPTPTNLQTTSRKTKGCLNCPAYFFDDENHSKACHYHTGRVRCLYNSASCSGGKIEKYSCCNRHSDEIGCTAGPHVEDKVTTAILSQFEGASSTPFEFEPIVVPNVEPKKEPGNIQSTPQDNDNFKTINGNLYLKYHINTAMDTLPGIALKFGADLRHLKQVNQIYSDLDFYSFQFLLIPWKEGEPIPDQSKSLEQQKEDERRAMAEKFARECKIPFGEAKWYLADSNYNWEAAKLTLQTDLAWERQHNVVHKTKF